MVITPVVGSKPNSGEISNMIRSDPYEEQYIRSRSDCREKEGYPKENGPKWQREPRIDFLCCIHGVF
jgi:hypothetical protein